MKYPSPSRYYLLTSSSLLPFSFASFLTNKLNTRKQRRGNIHMKDDAHLKFSKTPNHMLRQNRGHNWYVYYRPIILYSCFIYIFNINNKYFHFVLFLILVLILILIYNYVHQGGAPLLPVLMMSLLIPELYKQGTSSYISFNPFLSCLRLFPLCFSLSSPLLFSRSLSPFLTPSQESQWKTAHNRSLRL